MRSFRCNTFPLAKRAPTKLPQSAIPRTMPSANASPTTWADLTLHCTRGTHCLKCAPNASPICFVPSPSSVTHAIHTHPLSFARSLIPLAVSPILKLSLPARSPSTRYAQFGGHSQTSTLWSSQWRSWMYTLESASRDGHGARNPSPARCLLRSTVLRHIPPERRCRQGRRSPRGTCCIHSQH